MFVRYGYSTEHWPPHTVSVFASGEVAEGFGRVVNEGHDFIGRAMLRKLAEDAQAEPTDPQRVLTVIPAENTASRAVPDPSCDPFILTVYALDEAARSAEANIRAALEQDGEAAVAEMVGAFLDEHGAHAQYLGSMIVKPFSQAA